MTILWCIIIIMAIITGFFLGACFEQHKEIKECKRIDCKLRRAHEQRIRR